jgi:hypothetical protein
MKLKFVLTAIVLATISTSCGSDSISGLAVQFNGTWSQIVDFPGVSTTLHLTVSDTTITGTGAYTIEAGMPGTIIVSGVISALQARFDLARSDGTTQHFLGSLTGPDLLSGISWYKDPVSESFQRTGP